MQAHVVLPKIFLDPASRSEAQLTCPSDAALPLPANEELRQEQDCTLPQSAVKSRSRHTLRSDDGLLVLVDALDFQFILACGLKESCPEIFSKFNAPTCILAGMSSKNPSRDPNSRQVSS